MSKRTGDRITDLSDDIRAASAGHFKIHSPEESARRAAKAREMRLRQRGGAPCGVCKGTRYSRPDTVCGRCLGRGVIISREVSSGSWFEPDIRPVKRHEPEPITPKAARVRIMRRGGADW